ncbi:hypothetical protein Taro_043135 [Colocasia esculenta]|uniref:Uncharacterized protein n=1 Tax=Colocasia esculenta TaxID=4460 RepID=A0A843WRB4_COLES|nr:hypothetical protein [Colocasia esculenta]
MLRHSAQLATDLSIGVSPRRAHSVGFAGQVGRSGAASYVGQARLKGIHRLGRLGSVWREAPQRSPQLEPSYVTITVTPSVLQRLPYDCLVVKKRLTSEAAAAASRDGRNWELIQSFSKKSESESLAILNGAELSTFICRSRPGDPYSASPILSDSSVDILERHHAPPSRGTVLLAEIPGGFTKKSLSFLSFHPCVCWEMQRKSLSYAVSISQVRSQKIP